MSTFSAFTKYCIFIQDFNPVPLTKSLYFQQANEHYLTPFIVLLVLDFLGYIVSEVLARNSGHGGPDRWKKNLLEIGEWQRGYRKKQFLKCSFPVAVVFSCIFSIVSHLYRVFGRQRQLQEQRLAGYRSISSSQEHIAMWISGTWVFAECWTSVW